MKVPILFKFLHIYNTQKIGNFPHTKPRKGDDGFTLLEVLAIALIVGILSSIAAPGWLAFINNQRVRTVNDRVLQTLRSAQSEAKRSKRDITVTFDPSADPPKAKFDTVPAQTSPLQTVTFDGGGEIKKQQIKLSAASCSTVPCTAATPLTFNYNGVVDPTNSNNPKLPFVVTVAPVVSGVVGGPKKCVIVETFLGGMRTEEGAACLVAP